MKKILIVGAGGFGRSVYNYIKDSQVNYPDWEVAGFINDNLLALEGYDYDINIVSTIVDYEPKEDEYLVVAIGSPQGKTKVTELLRKKGAKFASFIHRTAFVGKNVKLGSGCVLCPNSIVSCDAIIGEFVTINCNSGVGHDAAIGNYSTLSAFVDITGYVKIGKRVLVGSHACVLPGVHVGDDAVIGLGSVVVRNVKAGYTVFGNPAKSIM